MKKILPPFEVDDEIKLNTVQVKEIGKTIIIEVKNKSDTKNNRRVKWLKQ
jgi:hypothetical protein